MERVATLLLALAAASPAATAAQTRNPDEPHRYRLTLSMGASGQIVDSEMTEQLEVASYDVGLTYDVSAAAQWWLERWLGLAAELWVRGAPLIGDAPTSIVTYSLLVGGSIAARARPRVAGGELALELAAGPALVRWGLRDETAEAVGLTVRLAARLGQGTTRGFAWFLRPWLSSTVGEIGPADLSTAGISGGVDAMVGWGWN